jgi:uncharacterized RDD family membrane protein YckC
LKSEDVFLFAELQTVLEKTVRSAPTSIILPIDARVKKLKLPGLPKSSFRYGEQDFMEYANIFQRALSFLLDLIIVCVLLAVAGASLLFTFVPYLVPFIAEDAGVFTREWSIGKWFSIIAIVALVGFILVSYAYLVWGTMARRTAGQRLLGLAVVREDGSAPNFKQATIRYLAGFLLPLFLPMAVYISAELFWQSRHAALKPNFENTTRGLTISPPEFARAYREWEVAGNRARRRLEAMLWLLYGSELAIMAAMITRHPRRQGWHDRLAKTFVIRKSAKIRPAPPYTTAWIFTP